jgi:hypothetical protein
MSTPGSKHPIQVFLFASHPLLHLVQLLLLLLLYRPVVTLHGLLRQPGGPLRQQELTKKAQAAQNDGCQETAATALARWFFGHGMILRGRERVRATIQGRSGSRKT